MGIILDSSVLIAAERQGQNARQAFLAIANITGDTDVAISVITLLELAHGAARANTLERKQKRNG
jgi:tRNA(fMet)-specific endonuclease VapC